MGELCGDPLCSGVAGPSRSTCTRSVVQITEEYPTESNKLICCAWKNQSTL